MSGAATGILPSPACIVCGAPLPEPANGAMERRRRCATCGAVRDVSGRLPARFRRSDASGSARTTSEGGVVRIVLSDATVRRLVLSGLGTLAYGFVAAAGAFLTWILLRWLRTAGADGTPSALARPVEIAAVGALILFLAWRIADAVAALVNRTIATLEHDVLAVRRAPLSLVPAESVPVSDVLQVYCTDESWDRPRRGPSFDVHAVLRDGCRRTLARDLPTLEEARSLERAIEDALGVEDRPVADEA